ncbi:glycosyltransferase family 4 protein [Micromonospora sp. NPDC000442]|uniref:glycosyltransferase family 4 protein n=1 Tax=Micromonospora sp. NPDC000442 TaxID=3364217 RepID=UPI00369C7BD9
MNIGSTFDLTVVLNYYAPYVSGLTEVARIIAEGMAARGHRVAVVTSRHDSALPARENRNGVEVVRAPVLARLGRGVVSPALPLLAARVGRRSRVVNLHLPMLEGGPIAQLCGDTPVVSTYHIDVWIPPSLLRKVQIGGVNRSARAALRRSAAVVVNSADQARHSALWPDIQRADWSAIPAPCLDRTGGQPAFRDGSGPHVGFMGRIVPDKGLEYLVPAFRRLADPDARLLIAGEYRSVAGGGIIEQVRRAAGDDPRIRVLGPLSATAINDFYASIDVFALTSVAESFGIVQAEAMLCGVPVLSSDLPGGRVPVTDTGFGSLVPVGDIPAITAGIEELLAMPADVRARGQRRARDLYSAGASLTAYENLFEKVMRRPRG